MDAPYSVSIHFLYVFYIMSNFGLVYPSSLRAFILLKTMQTRTPAMPITKKRNAAPEPFSVPKIFSRSAFFVPAIKGSKTLSTRKPPRKYPTGMEKNWSVLRTEYTRPSISFGTVLRKITS